MLEVVDAPEPEPRAGEVKIRVHAATVNRTDCGGLWGTPFVYRFFVGFPRPRHRATGTDFAGEIVAVGEGVTQWKVGNRVWGFDDNGAGSHAQWMTYAANKPMATIPAGTSYAQAAACAEGAHYAINFLNKVQLEAGQRVLVNGATGAIGSAAVQLLKHRGLHVTAVCAGPHMTAVRALGADRVIDFEHADFTSDAAKYQFVFDAVGKSTFGACKRLLEPRGVYISSELGPGGQNPLLALVTPWLGGKKVVFPFPVDIPRSLATIADLVDRGQFTPLIDRTHRLDEIREAFTYVASGRKIGNVVLDLVSAA